MSYRALQSSASGMAGGLFQLDTIANNLANADTTGFKRSRTNFEDLFYEHFKIAGAPDAGGQLTASGVAVGLGSRVKSTQADFGTGSFEQTGRQLDIAIAGEGFLQVDDGSGNPQFTRDGAITINANGDLVLASADRGRLLQPNFTIPADATEINISGDGVISVRVPGQAALQELGQMNLARFINPEGLIQVGENLFEETPASGNAITGPPGSDGIGSIRQNFLEASNVEPVQELVDLIKTQRTVELNSQALQAGDQMLQLVSNLRRG